MIITLIGAKTYNISGRRFVKDKPVEVSYYIATLALKTGLFKENYSAELNLTGKPTIYYPSTVEYDIMKQRPHHLLKALSELGYFVVFVDKDAKEPIRKFGNFYVVANDVKIKFGKPSVLYWTYPRHVHMTRFFDYKLFDTIDLPEGAFHHWKEGYQESLECADMIIASADLLYNKAKEVNSNVHLVPNSVDYEMFKTAQNRIEPKPDFLDDRPVVGFYGAIATWIDTDLMIKAAKALPEYQFLIIGPSYGKTIINPPDNMIMTGLVDYETLPWYLSWFDVGIIPFMKSGVATACNPMKMWEYMAAGKTFVTTNLPEAKFGVAATSCDFAYKIQWAMKQDFKEKLIAEAEANNWEVRAKSIPLPFKPGEPVTSKDESEEIHVFTACSPSWFMHLEKQIYAMDKLCSKRLVVSVLTDIDYNFTQYENTIVDCYNVDYMYKRLMPHGYNVEERYTKYTLYRLLIPMLTDANKVIYLDADTLVNCDLWDLYNRPVDTVAGVIDTGAEAHKKALGLYNYVNAGVLLMNLANIRPLLPKWLAMVNSKKYQFNDQDIINLTCNVELLPPYFNQSVCTPPSDSVGIMHYAGDKPWNGYHSALWDSVNYRYRIPKIIHYCWFGGGKKPPLIEECIRSFSIYCKDYTIIEWNETRINVNSHPYLKAAYESGKYAFVNDYVRFHALKHFGGITVDADYELLKPIDEFRVHRAFTGKETEAIPITAIIGAEANHPFANRVLQYYDKAKFEIKPNTSFLPGLMNGEVEVYPVETFASFDHIKLEPKPTDKSYGLHHFAGTWLGREPK